MKCSKCGHRARTIAAMAKHYRKKHAGAMKRRAVKTFKAKAETGGGAVHFCPNCGAEINPCYGRR